jgi:predicted HTH domain antitoxin
VSNCINAQIENMCLYLRIEAKSYERGKISLREASKLLNLSLLETIDLLMETGVKGNIRVRDVMDSLKTGPSKT